MGVLDLSEYVRVTNRTGEPIEAGYDGKMYLFDINEPTDVHHHAAAHIFGFGVQDKTNAFHRLGWLNFNMTMKDALNRLNAIEFSEVPNPSTNITAAVNKPRRAKSNSPTPLADVGVEAGERGNSLSPSDAPDFEDVVGRQ
jgi:hypothetical protein